MRPKHTYLALTFSMQATTLTMLFCEFLPPYKLGILISISIFPVACLFIYLLLAVWYQYLMLPISSCT